MAAIAPPPTEIPPRGVTHDVLTDIVNACATKGPHDSLLLATLAAKHLPLGARVVATYRREGGAVWRHFLLRFYKKHYDLRAMCLQKLGKAAEYVLVEYPSRGERRGDLGQDEGTVSRVGFKMCMFERALHSPQEVLEEFGEHVPQYSWMASWSPPSIRKGKCWPQSAVDAQGFLDGGDVGEEFWRDSNHPSGWWLEWQLRQGETSGVTQSVAGPEQIQSNVDEPKRHTEQSTM